MLTSLSQLIASGGTSVSVPDFSSSSPSLSGTNTTSTAMPTASIPVVGSSAPFETVSQTTSTNTPVANPVVASTGEKDFSNYTYVPVTVPSVKPKGTVPNLVGTNISALSSTVASSDSTGSYFILNKVTVPTGAKYDENIIFEQSPTAGSLAESNSTITVWYHVVYSGLQKKYETLL